MKSTLTSIITKQRDARFWQYVSLALVTVFTLVIVFREVVPKPQPQILVIGENGYYMGKLEHFNHADELHKNQAEITALVLLQRSPGGLDYQKRLGRLLGPEAFAKSKELTDTERREFATKSLHQKVEIADINILKMRGNSVLTHVTGQLIRTGSFENKPFIEVLWFKLAIEFIRNPNMADNGYYPSIVRSFQLTTTPITRS